MNIEVFVNEIERRGGEIEIVERPWLKEYVSRKLKPVDIKDDAIVLHCEGWRYYSRRFGSKFAAMSYVCGIDDSGPWAVRIPGTIKTVADALDWITPASVKKAIAAGKRVIRQGDVYAVETAKQHDGIGADNLERHEWLSYCRFLLHPEHTPISVPFPVRFVQQRVYKMGRTSRRGAAD